MDFEWDPDKASTNAAKHSVSFEEATEVFGDPLSSTAPDPDHSLGEDRFVIFGKSSNERHLVVSFTDRGDQNHLSTANDTSRSSSL